ncbi:hypothetical protein L593_03965 [Salinarchaeum sp. Harcht-Bsk1]|uniref:hypothetical protein n=1 Tax=Salinarchaeum sp. Harcht-Bsk1 TaxID=1333523 RepID=UPI000342428D|nr:hypothetical protein [Salinarchaeum sp. Harcht-Bsk1]AGN00744.1 hypothetical protein L593_03965 [Salinarchaeum sp. Harcht-Bsk1]
MPSHGNRSRRTVLLAAGGTLASALAGCADVASKLPGDDGDDSTESTLRARIEDYFAAVEGENPDALAEVVHPSSPMHPDYWDDNDDWEFQGYATEDGATNVDYEIDAVQTDATVADVRTLEYAEFWFEGDELETILDGEDVAIVELDSDVLEANEQDHWVFATADGEWRLFLASTESSVPTDPEDAFQEPIHDQANDVVDRIDWDYEPSSDGEGREQNTEWARVVLTDDPGIDADTIRVESTIADAEAEFYSEQNGPVSSTWAGSWASIPLHPEGDQIVVTAIDDGEETVVHRVHYEG